MREPLSVKVPQQPANTSALRKWVKSHCVGTPGPRLAPDAVEMSQDRWDGGNFFRKTPKSLPFQNHHQVFEGVFLKHHCSCLLTRVSQDKGICQVCATSAVSRTDISKPPQTVSNVPSSGESQDLATGKGSSI